MTTLSNQTIYNAVIIVIVVLLVIYIIYLHKCVACLHDYHTKQDKQDETGSANMRLATFTPPGGSSDFMLTDSSGNMYTMPTTNVSSTIQAALDYTTSVDRNLYDNHIKPNWDTNRADISNLQRPPFINVKASPGLFSERVVSDDNIREYGNGVKLFNSYVAYERKFTLDGNYYKPQETGYYRLFLTMSMYGDNGKFTGYLMYRKPTQTTGTIIDEQTVHLDQAHLNTVTCYGYYTASAYDVLYFAFKRTGGNPVWINGLTFAAEKIGEW